MSTGLAPVDRDTFRAACGRFASGVTVVATRRGGATTAKTVSAFSSLSLDPPLVGVAVGGASPLADALLQGGGFGVSVLRADQAAISDHFATHATRRPIVAPAGFVQPVRSDAPVLDDCLAWFGCTVVDVVRAGDHLLAVGHVLAVDGDPQPDPPLVHHGGRYGAVAPPSPRSPAP